MHLLNASEKCNDAWSWNAVPEAESKRRLFVTKPRMTYHMSLGRNIFGGWITFCSTAHVESGDSGELEENRNSAYT